MLLNYLKIAVRNLLRHKVFSLINIFGLALGMTCCILILLWVKDELSFDRFHTNLNNMYRVISVQHYPGADDLTIASAPGILAPTMRAEFPEVEQSIRVEDHFTSLLTHGEKALKIKGAYADSTFFKVFSFPLRYGNADEVLNEPGSIVISDSVALKFFGTSENVVGKVFKVDDKDTYRVTGVMKNVPANSSLQFDFVMPFSDYLKTNQWLKNWSNYGVASYLQLKPGTDVAAFNQKIKNYTTQEGRSTRDIETFVQPVKDIHLYSDFRKGKQDSGAIIYVKVFSAVAVFILLIACIN
ncbi:MAG: ABC transporter permease, partial [Hymenobacteraceae bacterium]|nr:ABC transporter permease [Hymenobacteraceae bacterium]MDX5396866.1 ABC transporter permease [Hymenobacteraceae bacterium]MDX5512937.1 ABC transporter permease [Hymenobacteraceae bacterium]